MDEEKMEKVSITVPASVLKQARKMAGKRPLSNFVAETLELRVKSAGLQELMREMDEEFGPVDEETMEWARKILHGR